MPDTLTWNHGILIILSPRPSPVFTANNALSLVTVLTIIVQGEYGDHNFIWCLPDVKATCILPIHDSGTSKNHLLDHFVFWTAVWIQSDWQMLPMGEILADSVTPVYRPPFQSISKIFHLQCIRHDSVGRTDDTHPCSKPIH